MLQIGTLNRKMETETIQKNEASLKSHTSKINFKSIFAVFLFLFCVVNTSFAEKVVGSYSLSYFNKQYDIEASEIKNGKFTVYIQVSTEKKTTKAMIGVESTDLEKFVEFLTMMKEKYTEWSDVAKKNNVTDMSKDMDFKSPSTTICWLGTKWWFSFSNKLQPRFMILDSGKMVVGVYKKVKASSNEYIDEKIYWFFSDAKEIDDLISQLDVEKIKSKLQENQNASDLFQ